jgi:hypothetical protein
MNSAVEELTALFIKNLPVNKWIYKTKLSMSSPFFRFFISSSRFLSISNIFSFGLGGSN